MLSGSGHIAGVINPPVLGKYQSWTKPDMSKPTLEEWLQGAEETPGSWWPDWHAWLAARSGRRSRRASPARGSARSRTRPGPSSGCASTARSRSAPAEDRVRARVRAGSRTAWTGCGSTVPPSASSGSATARTARSGSCTPKSDCWSTPTGASSTQATFRRRTSCSAYRGAYGVRLIPRPTVWRCARRRRRAARSGRCLIGPRPPPAGRTRRRVRGAVAPRWERDGTAWRPWSPALARSGRRTGAAQCAALAGSERQCVSYHTMSGCVDSGIARWRLSILSRRRRRGSSVARARDLMAASDASAAGAGTRRAGGWLALGAGARGRRRAGGGARGGWSGSAARRRALQCRGSGRLADRPGGGDGRGGSTPDRRPSWRLGGCRAGPGGGRGGALAAAGPGRIAAASGSRSRRRSARTWRRSATGGSRRTRGIRRPISRPGRTSKKARRGGSGRRPETARAKPLEHWFQDEARVGQQGTLTRVWAKRRQPPASAARHRYQWAYVFSAVCPERGEAAGLVMPFADTPAMNAHLAEIAAPSLRAPTPCSSSTVRVASRRRPGGS